MGKEIDRPVLLSLCNDDAPIPLKLEARKVAKGRSASTRACAKCIGRGYAPCVRLRNAATERGLANCLENPRVYYAVVQYDSSDT